MSMGKVNIFKKFLVLEHRLEANDERDERVFALPLLGQLVAF